MGLPAVDLAHGDDPPSGPGRNAERNFRGGWAAERNNRSNETHASTTDPDARLYRKSNGQPSRLCFMGHLLIENRSGLIVNVRTTHASGRAEREAAEAMIQAATQGPLSAWLHSWAGSDLR